MVFGGWMIALMVVVFWGVHTKSKHLGLHRNS